VFQGGMWLPTPSGGRMYAKYQRHIVHPNGIWTWIGTVETVHGAQQVVLTFGQGGVFGTIPQASGFPLRIVTSQGETRMVETSAEAMARSVQALRLHAQRDYAIPPRVASKTGHNTLVQRAAAEAVAEQAAASSEPVTIDVLVAYTQGLAGMLGSQSLALTRIQNLVDITNQAYLASGVNQQIRLVYTVEVSYPDNTSNQTALDEITGIDEYGNPVSIPSSLATIASLRTQYGADLVVMLRRYDHPTQSDCGVGWLNGGGQTGITSDSNAYGYSVVSDGSSSGFYCLDTTFAHELGHNMGDAHDRAHADKDPEGNPIPGAYSYSFGYVGSNFSTIMAYGSPTDTPLAVFSNPYNIICNNKPCGVADNASNSADNVHSMNNTAAMIAAFEPTQVGGQPPSSSPGPFVHDDVNGDSKSDLLWYNPARHEMTYWRMNGPTMMSWQGIPVPASYAPIASGDFNGDGYADLLWKDSAGNVYMWLNNRADTFTSKLITQAMSGWQIMGTVDVNGDGDTDLIWYHTKTGQVTYWLMDGTTLTAWRLFSTSPGLQLVATGDFDGNGNGDIIWKATSGAMYMWLFNSSGAFNYYSIGQFPSGWVSAGTGDVNADGKTDLFWYNASTGQMTYWLMNGVTLASWRGYHTNKGLTPLATGAFDGTNTGLTWKAQSGAMYMWLFDKNTAALSYYSLGAYPSGWTPVP